MLLKKQLALKGVYCGLRTGFLPCNYGKKRFFHSLTYSFNRDTLNKLASELKNMEKERATGRQINEKMYGGGGLKTGMLEGNTDRGTEVIQAVLD